MKLSLACGHNPQLSHTTLRAVFAMVPLAILFGLPGPFEFGIVAMVVLLLFGNRLPGAMRSLGKGVVEFKRGLRGDDDPDAIENKQEGQVPPGGAT